MPWIEIAKIILSTAELALKAKEIADKKTPDAGSSLKEKTRWIQCTVKNATQFNILLEGNYFGSGRYEQAPASIDPFTQMTFSCCNGDNTIMTGVSGGTSFRVTLDDNVSYPFAIGWTSPYVGAFKAGVAESESAEEGYNQASENGKSLSSKDQYTGKDKDKNEARFYFHLSAAPGQQAMFVITQVRVA
ncbi:hypothetical protein ABW19_dt0206325 [Dactylella cylindrospora]|nr:hypothetical protein ABW19_dt0206325 [Dactylella cylindrospora]